jgi:hypothetical protein
MPLYAILHSLLTVLQIKWIYVKIFFMLIYLLRHVFCIAFPSLIWFYRPVVRRCVHILKPPFTNFSADTFLLLPPKCCPLYSLAFPIQDPPSAPERDSASTQTADKLGTLRLQTAQEEGRDRTGRDGSVRVGTGRNGSTREGAGRDGSGRDESTLVGTGRVGTGGNGTGWDDRVG